MPLIIRVKSKTGPWNLKGSTFLTKAMQNNAISNGRIVIIESSGTVGLGNDAVSAKVVVCVLLQSLD